MDRTGMADDRSGLVLFDPWGVRIRMGDGGGKGSEYASAHYGYQPHPRTGSGGHRLAWAHRVSVLVVACLLLTIPLIVYLTTGR